MNEVIQKTFFGVIALGVGCIAIELIPVSRQAAYWNRCLDSTLSWANESSELSQWGQRAKDALAVGVCNGAVYEPKLITN